MEKTGKK